MDVASEFYLDLEEDIEIDDTDKFINAEPDNCAEDVSDDEVTRRNPKTRSTE